MDDDAGVWVGRSLGIDFGAGAEGVDERNEAGAGVCMGSLEMGGGLGDRVLEPELELGELGSLGDGGYEGVGGLSTMIAGA